MAQVKSGVDQSVMQKLILSKADGLNLVHFNSICEQREIDEL